MLPNFPHVPKPDRSYSPACDRCRGFVGGKCTITDDAYVVAIHDVDKALQNWPTTPYDVLTKRLYSLDVPGVLLEAHRQVAVGMRERMIAGGIKERVDEEFMPRHILFRFANEWKEHLYGEDGKAVQVFQKTTTHPAQFLRFLIDEANANVFDKVTPMLCLQYSEEYEDEPGMSDDAYAKFVAMARDMGARQVILNSPVGKIDQMYNTTTLVLWMWINDSDPFSTTLFLNAVKKSYEESMRSIPINQDLIGKELAELANEEKNYKNGEPVAAFYMSFLWGGFIPSDTGFEILKTFDENRVVE